MHGNKLAEIDSNLFKGLYQLRVISLHDLDSKLIDGLTSLHRIFTFDNQLNLNELDSNLLEYVQDFI